MRLVPANQPLQRVHVLLMQGHQVLRITPGRRGQAAILWDRDLERLRATLRLYGIPRAEIFSSGVRGPWQVRVWGRVLERLCESSERARAMGATA